MDHTAVVTHVADDLTAAEQAMDEAIVRATALVQSMIGARSQLSLSPVMAAASQAKAMEAIASLSAARASLVECHGELAKDHRRLGFGAYAHGLNKGERPDGTGPVTGHLRVA